MNSRPSRRQWLLGLLTGCFGLLPVSRCTAVPPRPRTQPRPKRSRLPEVYYTHDGKQALTIDPPGPATVHVYDARGNLLHSYEASSPPD